MSDTNSSDSYKQEAFKYQLEILKMEIDIIDKAITRIDEITQSTKNWAVVIWSGSIGLLLSQPDLRQYVVYTAVIPALFWLVDAWWRHYLEAFVYRQDRISDFLNDSDFIESHKRQRFVNFTILDPRGSHYKETKEYKKIANFWKSLFLRETILFYFALVTLSMIISWAISL